MGSKLRQIEKKATAFDALKKAWEKHRINDGLPISVDPEALKDQRRKARNKRKANKK